MATTDSRVRSGLLTLGSTPSDFSAQVTAVSIEPGEDSTDPVEVLDGSKVGGSTTFNDTLNFTVISDHSDASSGIIAYSWKNRGQTVAFEFQPDDNVAHKWTGTVIVQAMTVGGSVGEQLNIDASWRIVSSVPPTGFDPVGAFSLD